MVRSTLAVLLGLLVALATMLLLEYLGMSLFPLPPGVDLDSEADLAQLVESAGIGKQLWVLTGWMLAAVAGGWVASRISHRHGTASALCVGALIVAGVLLNVALLPHPAWMTVLGVLLPLPAAWAGARLARRPAPKPAR
jgi:MFS family permease